MATLRKLSRSEMIIKTALAFPTDDIAERYSKEAKIPLLFAREHATEVKKYLALRAIHPKTNYGMSPKIDGFWHVFIWHTVAYHRFCKLVAGGYIHHHPITDEEKQNGTSRDAYPRTLKAYEKYFGKPPQKKFWPSSKDSDCRGSARDLFDSACCGGGSDCR